MIGEYDYTERKAAQFKGFAKRQLGISPLAFLVGAPHSVILFASNDNVSNNISHHKRVPSWEAIFKTAEV